MWGMRRIQFYLLKIGKTPLIKRRKLHVLCMSCISAPFVYLKMFAREWRGAFFRRGGNKSRLSPLLPPLAGRGNSASIITSSYIFSLPVSLMFFFFFPFSFFFPSPDHTVHTTDSDQRAASKPEQETRAKGVLSLLLPPPPPPLSSFLDTSLQTAQAQPRCWARRCLAWAGP